MNAETLARTFELGPQVQVRRLFIGAERQPLMIVDGTLADPQSMIDAACDAVFYQPEHTNYPGINAPLPLAYCHTVVTALRGPIEAAFGLSRSTYLKYFGFFALATIGSAEAQPIQKIPHHDSPDPNRLALVHYLCRGEFGGTGFFRHLRTGFESVDRSREATYVAAARSELAIGANSAGYAGPQMANYQLIGQAEAVFNRLIIYRSHVLHSALLAAEPGSADPVTGRLTANGFIATIDLRRGVMSEKE